jgi:hypothetical protein
MKKTILNPQYQLFVEMVDKSNINMVTCGNCGTILLHRRGDENITCFGCNHEMALSDCPDYYNIDEQYIEVEEEETIPITLGLIKNTCGWSEYCDVTGGNHYMLKEWNVEDTEIFHVKKSHAKQLGFIK